ncbi:PspC domain-containing protein [Nonomuraea rubra]|uniref:PspC domain-containing protein n=1 Tax=Nonomuraea rubra TaxID=46180 RepID=UPI003614B0C4
MADQKTLAEQSGDKPYRRMMRPMEGRLLGGVAQGLAAQLKLDPVVIRLMFVLLTVVQGAGAVAYAVLWMVTPRQPYQGQAPQRDWSQLAAFSAIGAALFSFGWLTGASQGGIGMLPFAVGGIGALILWQQADPERRKSWVSGASRSMSKNRVRTLLGIILVVVGATGFLAAEGELPQVRESLLFTVVVVGGLLVIAAPWLAGLWKELQLERRERIRQEERAEVAAMVHDSVLHTLTLIQRVAHDPGRSPAWPAPRSASCVTGSTSRSRTPTPRWRPPYAGSRPRRRTRTACPSRSSASATSRSTRPASWPRC